MTADAPAPATDETETSTESDTAADRQAEFDQMLEQLDAAAAQCLHKIDGDGRITDAKKEQARAKWVNSLVRVVKERRQVLEARELQELAEEIEELKDGRDPGGFG